MWKIEYAGVNCASFQDASKFLGKLADTAISAKHVQRVTERIGRERQKLRDENVVAFKAKKLSPRFQDTPQLAVIMADAGKVQTREDGGKPGVRAPHWRDQKTAILANYPKPEIPLDYQPDPPPAFVDRASVPRLCAEIERVGKREPVQTSRPSKVEKAPPRDTDRATRTIRSPKPIMRTTVATMANLMTFGWIVAAEAHLRNFYSAVLGAIIGDGAVWITTLAKEHFDGWVRILDFLHLMAHIYAAANAALSTPKQAWELYEKLIRLAWAGKVREILDELQRHRERLGAPPEGAGERDPRVVLAANIHYITENQTAMDYPSYRRAGFPVTSALVESGIKQYNRRLKGSEKFWSSGGAEAVLQGRAAHLSEDDRASRHFTMRPRARVYTRCRLKRSA